MMALIWISWQEENINVRVIGIEMELYIRFMEDVAKWENIEFKTSLVVNDTPLHRLQTKYRTNSPKVFVLLLLLLFTNFNAWLVSVLWKFTQQTLLVYDQCSSSFTTPLKVTPV